LNNRNKQKPTIIPNIEQQQNKQNPTIIPNIEQQQQTKSNYNTNYGTIGTNKNQLQHQIVNSRKKQKSTIIPNIEQEKTNYKTKY
jgi:DNA-binding protein H-NS